MTATLAAVEDDEALLAVALEGDRGHEAAALGGAVAEAGSVGNIDEMTLPMKSCLNTTSAWRTPASRWTAS